MASGTKLTPLHQIKRFPVDDPLSYYVPRFRLQEVVRHLVLEPLSRPIQIQQVHTGLAAFLVISQEENRIIGQNSLD